MQWQDYVNEEAPAVVEFVSWLSGLHHSVQLDLVARMDALEARAAHGDIQVPEASGLSGDLDAIRGDPDLYELRWTLLTKQVRQYHAEPGRFPDHLVKLHLHIKGDTVRRDPIAPARQENEIRNAIDRYQSGDALDWDISPK